jgi:hypothetical protein
LQLINLQACRSRVNGEFLLPKVQKDQWNPILSISSVVLALEMFVDERVNSTPQQLTQVPMTGTSLALPMLNTRFDLLTSKKRKRELMSDSGTSEDSNTSTTDVLLKEARNPMKRLRRQLEELDVKSPNMTGKSLGPGHNTSSIENSAE